MIPLYKTFELAYLLARDNSPEKFKEFIDAHPVYTVGIEGILLGTAVTLAAVYGPKLIDKQMKKKNEKLYGTINNYSNKVQEILYKSKKIKDENGDKK